MLVNALKMVHTQNLRWVQTYVSSERYNVLQTIYEFEEGSEQKESVG